MRDFAVQTLQWAIGAFCAFSGVTMLVVPHQYTSPAYRMLQPHFAEWGVVFLLVGGALLAVAAFNPRRALIYVAHLAVGASLLLLAYGFAMTRTWTATVNYTVLGLGTALAPLLAHHHVTVAFPERRDLFGVLMGIVSLLTGFLLLLVAADRVTTVLPSHLLLLAPWYGSGFVLGGIALLYVQLRPWRSSFKLIYAVHLLAAAPFLAWVAPLLPERSWTAIALYGGLGVIVTGSLPWLAPQLHRPPPASLRLRLALALAVVAAVPLILQAALVTEREEELATEQALEWQQRTAAVLAQEVAGYVGLHLAAVSALASQPGLIQMDADEQLALLRSFNQAYPDAFVFATYDAEGALIARSDERPGSAVSDRTVFLEARASGSPSIEIRLAPSTEQPVFFIGVPIRPGDGTFAGLAVVGIESTQLFRMVTGATVGEDNEVYIVDSEGHVIAHSDEALVESFANISSLPPVAALLGGDYPAGAFQYGPPENPTLAGYALVPELAWGVVLERPSRMVLASMYASRDFAFTILLLLTSAAFLAGLLAATWLTAPLKALARALSRFAVGDEAVPLPRTPVPEVAQVTNAFDELRQRLLQRTQEREQALAELREQNETIETINHIGRLLAAELDLEKVVQAVTDAATELTDAQFGAFFYNVIDESGESYRLYALSGVPREAFEQFPLPHNTKLFGPTFRGERVIRLDDVTQSPYFGKSPPHYGLPAGHLPVTSYLAVPVISRSGEVLGGLFLGHAEAGIFTERDEHLVEGLAAQAAIAMDNARLYEEAQQAVRLREQFLGVASHELKSPLTTIKGYTDLLLRRTDHSNGSNGSSEQALRIYRVIQKEALRLNEMIDLLLDLSHVQSGRLQLERKPLDIAGLVHQLVETLHPTLEEHVVEVVGTDEVILLSGDHLRLEQVLRNLIANAVKYSPDGGRICVHLQRFDHHVRVIVSDQGMGISADDLPHIFEQFYRATNSAQREISGTGLGLYVVRHIVEAHGGTIEATSEPGLGSTFTVTLPLL
ncbi:MAG: ATP-binding protein [Chloroflexota bacterium]|nr:ATP-binding protein [Chloroflexota bacterium]